MSNCSVVIVSYYTGPVLFACIKTVFHQQQLAEVIVVDNGNPPEIVARLQQMTLTENRLKIITGQGNTGFSRGCNTGAKIATGDFLLLLNPDCLLPPDALVSMMDAFDEVPGAMLAGGRLLNSDGSDQRHYCRPLLTPKTAILQMFGLDRFHKTPMPEETHEVPAISGAFMCMKKLDYNRLFGLDEGFFLHIEDFDLCMRVHKAGGKVICVPWVRVTHMRSGKMTPRFIEWQKTKGFMRYFRKHFKGQLFPGVLLLMNLGILLRFALKVSVGAVQAWLRREPVMAQTAAAKRLMVLASGVAELPETQDLAGTTVLVTGATSQVGLCVLRRLLVAGASVLAVSRMTGIPFQHERLRWIKGDLTDKSFTLEGQLADVLIHCAPLWQLPPVLPRLGNAGIRRVVAFGSTSVFAKALSKNHYEKDMVSKLRLAENDIANYYQASAVHWTILRPTMIYGVGLDENVTSIAKIIRRTGFFPVYPPASGRRQPVHADDLALAALQVLNVKATYGKSYNMSGGENITYRDMLERIFKVCRNKTRIIETTMLPFVLDVAGFVSRKKHINGEIARRMNDDLIFFHDEAKKDFHFSPRSFLNGGLRDIEGF